MSRKLSKKLKLVMIIYLVLLAFWIGILIIGMSYFSEVHIGSRFPRSVAPTEEFDNQEKATHLQEVVQKLEQMVIQHQQVKARSLEGHGKVTPNATKVTSTKDECTRFLKESKEPHVFITDVLKPFNSHEEKMLSLMTHIDVTKLPRLLQLVDHWPGPMSVSVLGPLDHIKTFVKDVINSTIIKRDNIVLHLMVKTNEFYNWNLMRQMAKNGASTKFIFLVDVDLLPSRSAFYVIKDHLASPGYKKDMALIVPAFEFMSPELVTEYPANKSELLKLWERKNVLPFHDHWKPGYGPTDYETWRDEISAYEVKYRNMFEPYVVFNKQLAPDFDISFILRDKVSFLYHLHCIGFRFFALPDIFVLHYPHSKDQTDHRKMINSCAAATYENFVKRLGNCSADKIKLRSIT